MAHLRPPSSGAHKILHRPLSRVIGILLTGGIAYSDYVTSRIRERVRFLAPVYIYPGEDEMLALAMNGIGVLKGEVTAKEYK